MQPSKQEKDREKVIQTFFDENGRLKSIPAQRKKQLYVYQHLLKGLEAGRAYAEKELDEYIHQFHEDHCLIRREFIINRYMSRDNQVYTLNPQEMWIKID